MLTKTTLLLLALLVFQMAFVFLVQVQLGNIFQTLKPKLTLTDPKLKQPVTKNNIKGSTEFSSLQGNVDNSVEHDLKFHKRLSLEKEFDISCSLVFNNKSYSSKVKTMPDKTTDDELYQSVRKGCDFVRSQYSFPPDGFVTTEEEAEYPIAYALLIHKNAHQVLQLISAIYSQHNSYCIHVDLKSPPSIVYALQEVSKCFPNIFLASKRSNVVYGSFYQLRGDLNCMEDLLKVPTSICNWTHLLNLCGQTFPLKTNLEIVLELKKLKGRNMIGGDLHPTDAGFLKRSEFVHEIENQGSVSRITRQKLVRTIKRKSSPPFNITLRKNPSYNILSRQFLNWVLFESEKAKALLNWCKDARAPDEYYWLMLDALPEAPSRTNETTRKILSQYYVWKYMRPLRSCRGFWKHFSCVFGSGDLPSMIQRRELFANKFDILYDSTPMICLRKWLDKRKKITNT